MIDDAFLSSLENYTESIGNTHAAEIIRNARRYLALRENEAIAGAQAGEVNSISGFYAEFDAAADRLLEECSSQAQNGVGEMTVRGLGH